MTQQEQELYKRSRQGKAEANQMQTINKDECKPVSICVIERKTRVILSVTVWKHITSKSRVKRLRERIQSELPPNEMAIEVSDHNASLGNIITKLKE